MLAHDHQQAQRLSPSLFSFSPTSTASRGERSTHTSHLTSCLLTGAVYLPRAYGVGHPRGYPAHAMTDPTPLPPMNHPITTQPKGTAARPLRPPTTCAPPGWAMPPLTLAGQRYAPRATEFCIDPAHQPRRPASLGRSRSASVPACVKGQDVGIACSTQAGRPQASSSQRCLTAASAAHPSTPDDPPYPGHRRAIGHHLL